MTDLIGFVLAFAGAIWFAASTKRDRGSVLGPVVGISGLAIIVLL